VYYNGISQTRTFKIVDRNGFSEDDLAWIRSLVHVSLVTVQAKTIRVMTQTEDAITEIITAINSRYCKSAHPQLSPLF